MPPLAPVQYRALDLRGNRRGRMVVGAGADRMRHQWHKLHKSILGALLVMHLIIQAPLMPM
jgi:hypothetical protein